MSTELRLRRGNSTATSTFVGAEGEITVNTTNDSIHVHDGVTAGGFQTARADLNNVTNATFAAKALAANVGGNITGNITGASTTATYVTIGSEGGILPNSRRIQSGNGIILSDGGGGGAASIAANISSSAPSNLGAAAAGVSTQLARADHVHQMPTASQVGAVSQTTYVIAGNGLTGTGNLSSNVTLSLNANLNTLGDVTTANVTNGDILVYNSATSKWNNTSNFPRLTTKYNSSNVGTANVISTLNFIAGAEVTVAANANVTTQTDITIPTIYSSTQIQNLAGNVGATGVNGGITATYDSVNKRLNLSANTHTITLSGAVTGNATIANLANATITTTIPANSVLLGTHSAGAYVSNVSPGLGLAATYSGQSTANVGANAILSLDVASNQFTQGARDAFSDGISNGTQNGITVTYNRSANAFSFGTRTQTVALTGAVTGSATSTNLANISINTVIASSSVVLGTHTTGAYLANVAAGSTLTTTWAGGTGNAGQTATLDVNVTSANFTVGARDAISTGFNNGTQGGINVVYNKSANSFSLSANTFTVALTGAVTGTATSTNLSNITISTVNAANGVILGTHTSGAYLANVAAGNGAVITWAGGSGNTNQTATVGVNVASDVFTMGARDAIGTGFTNGTHSGITVVYNRAANAYSFSAKTFTVSLTGPITGTNTVSSLSNVSITTQIAANSVTLGTHTVGSYVSNVLVSGTGLSATTTGGANAVPTIALNSASTNTPNSVVLRDASGNFSANTITGSLTGLASQNLPLSGGTLTGAVTLAADPSNNLHAATKRYVDNAGANVAITVGGDVTASGTASSLITTLANSGVTAGTYTGRFTIDQKGRITSAANVTTLSGYGITDGVNTSSSQSVGGNKTFNNDVTVMGNLIVQGNSTSLSVTSVSTSDKTITVASGATGASTADQSGIKVAGANANILYDYVSNSWQINKPLTPATTGTQDIGTATLSWRNAYLSGNLTVGGTINASVTGTVTAAGNVSGGTQYSLPYQTAASTTTFLAPSNTGWVLTTNGLAGAPAWVNPSTLTVGTATSATTAGSAGSANTAVYVTGGTQSNITAVGTLTGLSVSGTVQPVSGSNASVSLGGVSNYWNSIYAVTHVVGTGGITNAGAAGTGNIGSTGIPFNTVHAVATSARYADLAEKYVTDQEYDVGTVIVVGGEAEVTASQSGDLAIGVISAEPAYLMNSESSGQAVALKGRVPVKVVGAVKKGQQLVAAEDGTARAVEGSHMNKFAVALETNDAAGVKLVEAIIL